MTTTLPARPIYGRKVTQNVVAAFIAGTARTEGNTSTDGTVFFLHGNPIARKNGGRLEISFAGWVTATTAERLNGILSGFGSAFRVGRRLGQPMAWANGVRSALPSNKWQAVSDVAL